MKKGVKVGPETQMEALRETGHGRQEKQGWCVVSGKRSVPRTQ